MQIETNRTSQATFNYVDGLKRYVVEKFMPRLRVAYEKSEQQYAQTHNNSEKPQTMEQVGEVMRPMTFYQYNRAKNTGRGAYSEIAITGLISG